MSDVEEGGSRTENDGTVVYETTADLDETELSTAILMALDSVPGYDLEDSESVLFDHVDLDAIDDLFTAPGSDGDPGRVTFSADEYRITATASGEISIRTR